MKEEETREQLRGSRIPVGLECSDTEPAATRGEPDIDETQAYRAGAYELLAALLRATPEQAVLEHIATLSGVDTETDELAIALSMLGLAASHCDINAIDNEYHALFIGLGRGELVPFGSWYLTGFLMEKPLGLLRDDLMMLGFERNVNTHEPEDHIAALCEVMALMINDTSDTAAGKERIEQQRQFFNAHIGSWAEQFFSDLSKSPSAVFYCSVGRFGLAFIEFEKRYLSMSI